MKTISKAEWKKIHKDYKIISEGQRYIMINNPESGAELVPVKVVN